MLPPLQRIPATVAAVADYEPLARERLSPEAWAYFAGGVADEVTLCDNREAFERIRLRGRVLAEFAGGGHTRVEILGRTWAHPIALAPVALQTWAHVEGERAAMMAAAATGATMVVSTQAGQPVEDIARAGEGAPWWFQLYMQPDRVFTESLVRRAEAAGCEALVVTVDAAVNGPRNREQRAGGVRPPGVEMVNLRGCRAPEPGAGLCGGLAGAGATWRDVDWLRALTKLPVLLKGIMDPEDAARAVESGASGIIVSNHGGRTLDTLPGTIDVLPAVAAAVAGRVPLLVDGGIRRGTDVLKALALGASAVLIGRPYVFALAAAGAPGVAHAVRILQAELEMAMTLTGCATPAEAAGALYPASS
ncbi:MAG: alpha-hydroxy acid oxidase [Verrucomicrobiota bacterium]